jgi:hypothetical protein
MAARSPPPPQKARPTAGSTRPRTPTDKTSGHCSPHSPRPTHHASAPNCNSSTTAAGSPPTSTTTPRSPHQHARRSGTHRSSSQTTGRPVRQLTDSFAATICLSQQPSLSQHTAPDPTAARTPHRPQHHERRSRDQAIQASQRAARSTASKPAQPARIGSARLLPSRICRPVGPHAWRQPHCSSWSTDGRSGSRGLAALSATKRLSCGACLAARGAGDRTPGRDNSPAAVPPGDRDQHVTRARELGSRPGSAIASDRSLS